MPSKTGTQHRHLKEAPHPRRKAKPKFEVPAADTPRETPVGWVYKADDAIHDRPGNSAQRSGSDRAAADMVPFLMVGMSMLLIGVETLELMGRAARGVFLEPMRIATRMLAGDR